MKRGNLISLYVFVSLALVGCGSSAGLFEKMGLPTSTVSSVDGVSGGDGYSAPIRQDFTQAFQYAAYDILWVLDNFASMLDEITYVRNNVEYFAQTMQARRSIQYQMAVTNTDWSDLTKGHGKLRGSVPVISYAHADPVAEFKDAVDNINFCSASSNPGCGTSGAEMGLNSTRQALTDNASAFIRSNANLFVILVSDENDVSCTPSGAGTACSGGGNGTLASTSTYVTYLNGVKTAGTGAMAFYPVVGITAEVGCAFASVGARYLDVLAGLAAGSGESGSICQSEMGNSLNRIANTIADNGLCFALVYPPNATTVDVFVDNVLVKSGYSLDSTKNAVCFDTNHIPQNGQKVGIEYYRP